MRLSRAHNQLLCFDWLAALLSRVVFRWLNTTELCHVVEISFFFFTCVKLACKFLHNRYGVRSSLKMMSSRFECIKRHWNTSRHLTFYHEGCFYVTVSPAPPLKKTTATALLGAFVWTSGRWLTTH